jgi:hypothetical protein
MRPRSVKRLTDAPTDVLEEEIERRKKQGYDLMKISTDVLIATILHRTGSVKSDGVLVERISADTVMKELESRGVTVDFKVVASWYKKTEEMDKWYKILHV